MSFEAKVLADSTELYGNRLITMELTFPRLILSEVNTHRMLSKNSASTRAIPLATQLRNLLNDPFIPEEFGTNQKGMQAAENLAGLQHDEAVRGWLENRDAAMTGALKLVIGRTAIGDILGIDPSREFATGDQLREKFAELTAAIPKSDDEIDLSETDILNVHKQLAGRGLESYMWQTAIITGTEWENMFALRDHEEAQPQFRTIAHMAKEAIINSSPTFLEPGEWHLPLVKPGEFDSTNDAVVASVARTAAVSFNRHNIDGTFERLKERHDGLVASGHMSPTEHQATPFDDDEHYVREHAQHEIWKEGTKNSLDTGTIKQMAESVEFLGNLRGWKQYRKTIPNEDNFGKIVKTTNQ